MNYNVYITKKSIYIWLTTNANQNKSLLPLYACVLWFSSQTRYWNFNFFLRGSLSEMQFWCTYIPFGNKKYQVTHMLFSFLLILFRHLKLFPGTFFFLNVLHMKEIDLERRWAFYTFSTFFYVNFRTFVRFYIVNGNEHLLFTVTNHKYLSTCRLSKHYINICDAGFINVKSQAMPHST